MTATLVKEEIKNENINLMNDALAKSILRSKEARGPVIKFLSGITHIPKRKFKDALFVGGEIPKNHKKEKGKASDVMCILKDAIIIIEVNDNYYQNLFRKNSLYAYTTLVSAIPINVEKYKRVILINIDSFNHFKVEEPIIPFGTKYKELEEHGLYTSYHVILANITNTNYNINEDVRKFGEFLSLKLTIEELKAKYEGDEEYMDIVKKVEEFMRDNNLVQYYDLEASHKFEVEDSFNTGVNAGRASGLAEGRASGLAEGRASGLVEGRVSGIAEGTQIEKHNIAKNLLKDHLDINKIMQYTGLTKQEILELQEN